MIPTPTMMATIAKWGPFPNASPTTTTPFDPLHYGTPKFGAKSNLKVLYMTTHPTDTPTYVLQHIQKFKIQCQTHCLATMANDGW